MMNTRGILRKDPAYAIDFGKSCKKAHVINHNQLNENDSLSVRLNDKYSKPAMNTASNTGIKLISLMNSDVSRSNDLTPRSKAIVTQKVSKKDN